MEDKTQEELAEYIKSLTEQCDGDIVFSGEVHITLGMVADSLTILDTIEESKHAIIH